MASISQPFGDAGAERGQRVEAQSKVSPSLKSRIVGLQFSLRKLLLAITLLCAGSAGLSIVKQEFYDEEGRIASRQSESLKSRLTELESIKVEDGDSAIRVLMKIGILLQEAQKIASERGMSLERVMGGDVSTLSDTVTHAIPLAVRALQNEERIDAPPDIDFYQCASNRLIEPIEVSLDLCQDPSCTGYSDETTKNIILSGLERSYGKWDQGPFKDSERFGAFVENLAAYITADSGDIPSNDHVEAAVTDFMGVHFPAVDSESMTALVEQVSLAWRVRKNSERPVALGNGRFSFLRGMKAYRSGKY